MGIIQRVFGFKNTQTITNNTIIVDEKYLEKLIAFQNNPSDLNQVVLALYNSISQDAVGYSKRALPPEIEDKLMFNNVVVYRKVIESNFSENGYFLDEAYNTLDFDKPGQKKIFLGYINNIYLKLSGELILGNLGSDKQEVINHNSDKIITQIINSLLLKISNNPKDVEHLTSESIEYSIIAIVSHAFVDCKVLENPNLQ